MIFAPVCLLLLIAPPSAAPRCVPDDLACTAEASVREADSATTPRVRAEALLTAARAYLLLYRRTHHRAHICKAQSLLGRLPRAQPQDLSEYLRKLESDLRDEEASLGFDCKAARPRPKSPVVARLPNLPQRTPSSPPPVSASDEPADALAAVPAANHLTHDPDEVLLELDTHEAGPARQAAAPAPATQTAAATGPSPAPERRPPGGTSSPGGGTWSSAPERSTWSSAPKHHTPDEPPAARPGRRLLIGGGVVLTSASLFGALAVGATLQRDQLVSKHDALASNANHDGYTAPADDVARRELAPEVTRWHRLMVGASISSSVLAGAAVALISTGAAKRWRLSRWLAVRPALMGVLLSARF